MLAAILLDLPPESVAHPCLRSQRFDAFRLKSTVQARDKVAHSLAVSKILYLHFHSSGGRTHGVLMLAIRV